MRKLANMLSATLLFSTIGISVLAEARSFIPIRITEITGKICDKRGNPVAGLKISERNWLGIELASTVTDENGRYDMRGVIAGRYYFNFRPLAENSRGETVIIEVPTHSVHLNLTVNRNPPAIAGNDIFTFASV